MRQVIIAADQLLNTFIPPYSGPRQGWADETLSSRAWRLSDESKGWKRCQVSIDWVFLKLVRQRDHCFDAWMSERLLRQMPPELRTKELIRES